MPNYQRRGKSYRDPPFQFKLNYKYYLKQKCKVRQSILCYLSLTTNFECIKLCQRFLVELMFCCPYHTFLMIVKQIKKEHHDLPA